MTDFCPAVVPDRERKVTGLTPASPASAHPGHPAGPGPQTGHDHGADVAFRHDATVAGVDPDLGCVAARSADGRGAAVDLATGGWHTPAVNTSTRAAEAWGRAADELARATGRRLTHGMCPDCFARQMTPRG